MTSGVRGELAQAVWNGPGGHTLFFSDGDIQANARSNPVVIPPSPPSSLAKVSEVMKSRRVVLFSTCIRRRVHFLELAPVHFLKFSGIRKSEHGCPTFFRRSPLFDFLLTLAAPPSLSKNVRPTS